MDRNRYPVSDLNDAVRWLWQYSRVEDFIWASDCPGDCRLPLEAQLVCDAFWVSPRDLVRRLRADWREACIVAPVAPVREKRHVWGR